MRALLLAACLLLNAFIFLYPVASGHESIVSLADASLLSPGARAGNVERRGATLVLSASQAPVEISLPAGGRHVAVRFSVAPPDGRCAEASTEDRVRVAVKDRSKLIEELSIGRSETIARTYRSQSGELIIAVARDNGSCADAVISGELSAKTIGSRYRIVCLAFFLFASVFAYELVRRGYAWYCALFYLGTLLFAARADIATEGDGSPLLVHILFVGLAVYALALVAKSRLGFVLLSGFYFVCVVLIPILFIVYADSSGAQFGAEQIHAILQSDAAEGLDYIRVFVDKAAIGKALVIAGGAVWMLAGAAATGRAGPASPLIGAVAFACGSVGLLNARAEPPYIGMFADGVHHYFALLEEQHELSALRARSAMATEAVKREQDEVHVLVIGESASRHHFPRYGYARDTDGSLRKLERLVWFDDAISPHTHTAASLQLALTAASVADPDGHYAVMPSVVEVAKAAGVRTYWISNQSNLGPWDNAVAVIAKQADRVTFLNRSAGLVVKTAVPDEALLAPFAAALNEPTGGSKFVVLHLMGSHWPYCDRYPKEFEKRFNGIARPGGNDDLQKAIDCYDNSVLYTSHLVARFIAMLERQASVASLVYLSDHSEDVLGMRGHESARFTRAMVEIPMFAWFSRPYAERYPKKVLAATGNSTRPFMSDALFHVVLDVMNIRTPLLLPARSLANDAYQPLPRRTLHGRFDYDGRQSAAEERPRQ